MALFMKFCELSLEGHYSQRRGSRTRSPYKTVKALRFYNLILLIFFRNTH